jgi:hypothetical protein
VDRLKSELFIRVDEEKDIEPRKDVFQNYIKILNLLAMNTAESFRDYQIISVSNGEPGNYLIKTFISEKIPGSYLKTQKDLKPKSVYLKKKKEDIFFPLSPYVFYSMCEYHYKRELFVFSHRKFDLYSGVEECRYAGDYFMCSPVSPLSVKSK